MRRSQSVRNHNARQQATIASDDLGVLRESDETIEDELRRKLFNKERECDEMKARLDKALADIHHLKSELQNSDILLQGTQRENQRELMEHNKTKARLEFTEKSLAKLVGPNWEDMVDLPPPTAFGATSTSTIRSGGPSTNANGDTEQDPQAAMNYIENVRLMIIGMEERLDKREQKLQETMHKAQTESAKFQEYQRQILT
ncbi:hypothetical protein K474DRAFT_589663 [Panus rudis PR-1116 ss-1]|nr:hypothetical protein K474DRAFT_589663 [Panus rudis PR-1116 ss-1]